MSYPFSPDPQNKGLNPDESPGSQCRGSAVGAGAAAPLGNLRNSRAAGGVGSLENASDCRKIPASEHDAKTVTQSERFDLQRASALLLPDMRVAHCLWTATGMHVDVIRRGGDARFEGVQTCGSWSSCPICSARIAETRRQELRALEEWAGSPRRGVRLVLMTLTARHRRRALGSLVKKMAAARNRMHGRKAYQRLRTAAIVGTVAVREATHGAENGWHPHYHVLMVVRADSDAEALEILEPLRAVWLDCLRKEGLSGTATRAFDIRGGDAVSAYLSKHGRDEADKARATAARAGWGISEEMTQSRTKRGRGTPDAPSRSPMQILRDFADGDEDAGPLWQEYCRVMFRKPQMVWSDGLKAMVGLGEVDDEQAAEGEEYSADADELIHTFDQDEWRSWRRWRGAILAAARRGPEAVASLLRGGQQRIEGAGEVIEDDAPAPPAMTRPAVPVGGLAARALARMPSHRRGDEGGDDIIPPPPIKGGIMCPVVGWKPTRKGMERCVSGPDADQREAPDPASVGAGRRNEKPGGMVRLALSEERRR